MNQLNPARTTSAARSSKGKPVRVILAGLAAGALSVGAFSGVAQAEPVSSGLAPVTASSTNVSLSAPLAPSASSEYQIGYREGSREGNRDNGYADGYSRGYDNGFDRIRCRRR